MATHVVTPPLSQVASRSFLRLSLYDIFFAVIILWSFMADPAGWQRLLIDGDTAFHIRIGDYILNHRQVPHQDVFSFSVPGQPWYAFEWLSEVAYALVHSVWALKGVVLLAGLCIGFAFTLMWNFSVWQGANSGVALVLVMLGLSASSFHFHARPHVFTWLFLLGAMWMVARDRKRNHWSVWLLAPLTALWANFHGGFFIFFALLGVMIVGLLIEAWLMPVQRVSRLFAARRYAMVLLASGAASLCNPYGITLHMHIAEVLRAKWILDLVDEFRSPVFRGEAMLVFLGLLFLGLLTAGRLAERRQVADALVILFLAYASLTSVRHIPIFVLIAVPMIAVEASRLWDAWVAHQPRGSTSRIVEDVIAQRLPSTGDRVGVWAFVFVAYLCVAPASGFPQDFSPDRFPVALVEKHQAKLATARVFCSDQWGGYLVYKNFPQQRIFIDGRHNYYGEKFLKETLAMNEGRSAWRQTFERQKFDVVLSTADSTITTLVLGLPDWRIVDRVGNGIMLERIRS